MIIYIGIHEKAFIPLFNISSSTTIHDIKYLIEHKTSIPLERQILVYKQSVLENEASTVLDCGLQHGSTLYAIMDLNKYQHNKMQYQKDKKQQDEKFQKVNEIQKEHQNNNKCSVEQHKEISSIHIRPIWGGSNICIENIDLSLCNVKWIKEILCEKEGIPLHEIGLVFRGKLLLNEDKLLKDYDGYKESKIMYLLYSVGSTVASAATTTTIKKGCC